MFYILSITIPSHWFVFGLKSGFTLLDCKKSKRSEVKVVQCFIGSEVLRNIS